MKKQIVFIHGGNPFERVEDYYEYLQQCSVSLDPAPKRWKDWLENELTDQFQFIAPTMPCKQNAKYMDWKIWFERFLPFIGYTEVILIGYSLGATFLLKYLSENQLNFIPKQIHLVAPLVQDEEGSQSLEKIATFAIDQKKLKSLASFADIIHLYHSTDDTIVPFENSQTIKSLLPETTLHNFSNRGHFFQEEFQELLENIYQKST